MKVPSKITQGDTATWLESPVSVGSEEITTGNGWKMRLAFRGPTQLDLVGATDGQGWSFTLSRAQTAALTAGFYSWQGYAVTTETVEDAEVITDRKTIESGKIEILRDFLLINTPFDGRTQTEKDLAAVQVAIRTLISGGAVQAYTIHGRSFEKMRLEELLQLESKLKFDLKKEQADESGKPRPNTLRVRF